VSRPPSPQPDARTARVDRGNAKRFDFLPLEFDDFMALEESLAADLFWRLESSETSGETGDESGGDFARTTMELTALVAHILAVYQDRYAGESFIGTARAASSLVRHARRLAYQPDSGLAATGYVVLFVKPELSGTVAKGLSLASVPLGEADAEDYETLDDVPVDEGLNVFYPADADRTVSLGSGATSFSLDGTGLGLEPGELVALVGAAHWQGLVITATDESLERRTTTIHIAEPLSAAVYPEHAASAGADGDAVMRVLAKPALALHPFGWNADPKLYPPANLKSATATPPANGADGYWYGVSANSYHSKDIYLSEDPANPLVGQYVLRVSGSGRAVFRVTEESSLSLSFNRRTTTTVKIYTAAIASDGSGGFSTSLTPVPVSVPVESHISATVKAIRVNNRGHVTSVDRAEQPLPATWLTGWRQAVPLARREPNPAPVDATFVDVPGMFPLIAPGRTLLFTNKAGTVTQVVAVSRAAVDASANTTRIWWDPIDPTPKAGWFKNDLKIYGNVVRVSHGRTLSEVLGGSDGVEPFQRFPLKQSPVTLMPTASGASPDLEVRVNDIRWQRVDDFASSGPDDRHYRFELDETQTATVVFGDGRNGAIPPAGKKNVTADYRVGLGTPGDVAAGLLSRIKRAHPLLDRAANLTDVSGGAEPARAEDVRTQATRFIRTFDRAVSIGDHADVALLYEGVARAAARWNPEGGIVLIVATANGKVPEAISEVRAFLDDRRDTTLPLVIRGPTARMVRLSVIVDPDPDYRPEQVKNAIRAALHGETVEEPGFFAFARRKFGEPAFLSEIYWTLESVEGVRTVEITRFEAKPLVTLTGMPTGTQTPGTGAAATPGRTPGTGATATPGRAPGTRTPPMTGPQPQGDPHRVFDVIRVAVDEWLTLDPKDLDLVTQAEAR
jgi:hypothetical protein